MSIKVAVTAKVKKETRAPLARDAKRENISLSAYLARILDAKASEIRDRERADVANVAS